MRAGRILFLTILLLIVCTVPVLASVAPQSAPPAFTLTPEMLAGIAGAVISLAFSYVPGLKTKFAALAEETKQLIMAGLLLLSAGVIFGLSCANILSTGITCDQQGIVELVWLWILAIMANQGVHRITPQTTSVKAIKAGNKTQGGP